LCKGYVKFREIPENVVNFLDGKISGETFHEFFGKYGKLPDGKLPPGRISGNPGNFPTGNFPYVVYITICYIFI
tara:strand:+ start:7157 stop:7378 length:222 start_codon:yes stop_codon:yes gene_type:complete